MSVVRVECEACGWEGHMVAKAFHEHASTGVSCPVCADPLTEVDA